MATTLRGQTPDHSAAGAAADKVVLDADVYCSLVKRAFNQAFQRNSDMNNHSLLFKHLVHSLVDAPEGAAECNPPQPSSGALSGNLKNSIDAIKADFLDHYSLLYNLEEYSIKERLEILGRHGPVENTVAPEPDRGAKSPSGESAHTVHPMLKFNATFELAGATTFAACAADPELASEAPTISHGVFDMIDSLKHKFEALNHRIEALDSELDAQVGDPNLREWEGSRQSRQLRGDHDLEGDAELCDHIRTLYAHLHHQAKINAQKIDAMRNRLITLQAHAKVLSRRHPNDTRLDRVQQLRSLVPVLHPLPHQREERDQRVLVAHVQVVVQAPVHLAHLRRGVEQPLQHVVQDHARPQRHSEAVDGVEAALRQVRARLEDVGPHVVEQVDQRVLAVEARHPQRQVLAGPGRRLPVHEVAVHQRVLQQRRDCVYVVLGHFANVLEEEAQRLEHAGLYVNLRHAVLRHQRWQHRVRQASLGHNCNCDSRAEAQLPLLHPQVVEQRRHHVVGADGPRDVAERVHSGAADALLVGLEQLQQVEADAVPLLGRDQVPSPVRDAAHQLNHVFLHLFVAVLQNGRQPRQQVLDGRRHGRGPDGGDDGLQSPQDAAQHLRVLLPQVLVQVQPQVGQHVLTAALAHDRGDLAYHVRRLLAGPRALRSQTPPNDAHNLRQVGQTPLAQVVQQRAERLQQDRAVVRRLLLKGVDHAVNEQLLQPLVELHLLVRVVAQRVYQHRLDALRDHHAEALRGVLQVVDQAADDHQADLVGDLHRGLDDEVQVLLVHAVAHDPEGLEEGVQQLLADVVRLDALRRDALPHHLQHNVLHLLVGRGKLLDQNVHDLLRVVGGIIRIHERYNHADGLQKRREPLAPVLGDALPERAQHHVERLDAEGRTGLGQGGQRQRRHRPDFQDLVLQPQCNDGHQLLQVRQHATAHQYCDLLDYFDARVARLPALFGLADGLKEQYKRLDACGVRHHRKRARSGVANVLVRVVDVRPHGSNHGSQPRCLAQVADDLTSLHPRVVVLVDEQRLDNHEDFVHVRPHLVLQLKQNAINDLHHQVALLVLQSRLHHQRQNLVEQRPRPKLPRLLRQEPKRLPPQGRSSVFDLKQERQNAPFVDLIRSQVLLRLVVEQLTEEVLVLGLHLDVEQQRRCAWDVVGFAQGLVLDNEAGRLRHVVVERDVAAGDVSLGGLDDFEALARQYFVEFLVGHVTVAISRKCILLR
ncbi:uncharacterized protein BcabD6B2_50450 [Babesia caballi]|uniref:Uncharacterized protein n=1 Tax=Babesia caballi TaxID=5871 RepID=A0AAV4M147_BABCB|nr:hypothetical protein, conserved [Babesia caballi]